MKKVIAFLLAICLCISLCACEPHSHTYSEWQTVTAANCTTSGLQERTCGCGEKETKTISETGHTFSEWKTTKFANCTTSGLEERSCVCGKKENRSIDALGHSTKNGICNSCYTTVGMSSSELQKHIVIAGVNVDSPNSAGGCKVTIAFKNTSAKEIKYITFYVTPYNGVKDIVKCEIRNQSSAALQLTGPIKSRYANYVEDWGYGSDYYVTADAIWSNVWYNYTIKYVRLNKIVIEYMDGTFLYINEDIVSGCFIPCDDNHI